MNTAGWTVGRLLSLFFASACIVVPAWGASANDSVLPVEVTCVDVQATGYGTFQSHNRKVLSNANGIFMTHIRSRNEAYTAQQWRLSRSIDGGMSFETVYEATHATNPAVIESDEAGNIYLVRPDFIDNNSYLYIFSAADEYRNPKVVTIPDSLPAGKFALAYDKWRRQLYYVPNNNSFHVISTDGTMLCSVPLWRPGEHAIMQYPSICVDDDKTLHAAWTTSTPHKYLYWDIHYAKSIDAGTTWTKMDGTPLTAPIAADDTGPSDRISLDDEFEIHTWLSSLMIRGGKAHFLYLAQGNPPRQHCMRYDLKSARLEYDAAPVLRGESIELHGLDGFFAASTTTLYCVGHTPDGRIGCLASDDQGTTWRDHAASAEPIPQMYAVGGSPDVTSDGYIIGSFTSRSEAGGELAPARVSFFKIPASGARSQ